MKVEKKQSVQGKKQRYKKFCLIALPIFLLPVLAGSGIAIAVYHAKYSNDASLAQTGMQDLRTAATLLERLPKNPLDALTVSQAQHEFASAMTTFVQLDDGLKSLPGISTFIPVYGARLSAALHLAPLAIGLSQAGMEGCAILNLLIARFHDPLRTQGQGLTMNDMIGINQEFQQIRVALQQAIGQANQIHPSDLQFDPHIGKIFATFRNEIPILQVWLDNAEKLLPILPTLLGVPTPSNYLIEVLDSTELRPTGGFIGNYGIATISGGRLIAASITDVDLLDKPFELAGHTIPYPPAYKWFSAYLAGSSWSFRDSNLDADFPTAARYGELNYKQEGGNVPVQGAIAITPAFIQQVLTIIGPIDVPEYHEKVTAQNLIDRIHYYQLGPGHGSDLIPSPDGHSSLRKRFTELLAEHLLARVRQMPSPILPQLMQLVMSSIHTKDVQIYFNSDSAENLLQRYHLDAAVQLSAGDGLFVVDTNVSATKANEVIINRLDDQVTLDSQGNAIHHTTLTYAWAFKGQSYDLPFYQDYVRVYMPPGSILSTQDGWQPMGRSEAFGHQVWAGFFRLYPGQSRAVSLIWTVPGAARRQGRAWQYQDMIQRQAGAHWTLHLQITLASCAVIGNTRGGMLVPDSKQTAALTQSLNEDLHIGFDYTC